MRQRIITQRQKYKVLKFSIVPMIDCFFLLLLLLIFLFFVENAPIQAIPVDIGDSMHEHRSGLWGMPIDFVTVYIENPAEGDDDGSMRFYEGNFPIWISPRVNLSKAEFEKKYRAWQKLHRRVEYDAMLSRLNNLPEEKKKIMYIYSGRQVLHEQIIRVLGIGVAGGVDSFEFIP